MAGNYNEELRLKGDPELLELADSLNDLSDVFRLTHENLAQEKNRLSSVLSYMSDVMESLRLIDVVKLP